MVSQGNRDVFEIGRARLPSSFNIHIGKEVPLIPRDLIFEVSARGKADGSVIEPVDETEIGQIADQMRVRNIRAVAVMLLNSYVDGGLEAQVADALSTKLPGVLVTRSAQLWPEIREYERALVTALNAYVHPMMDHYLEGPGGAPPPRRESWRPVHNRLQRWMYERANGPRATDRYRAFGAGRRRGRCQPTSPN